MIGMNFVSFLILLVISVVVSAILHYVLKFYLRPGIVSFISKIIFGWIGAWLGSPVFGNWFGGLVYEKIYIIPAILGSFALLIIMVDLVLTVKSASAEKP
jgi:uncharacterized membrane protein YeaQ/YmgE (transglycosylase-associated protein family)